MSNQTQEIFDDIKQLIEQYRAEVPGKRRAWPEAIKSRVRAACGIGLPLKEIAARAGLPYYTIIAWAPKESRRRYRSRQKGSFSELSVTPAEKAIATVTVARERSRTPIKLSDASQSATVTVTLPGGIEIKGVTPEFLASWLGRAQ